MMEISFSSGDIFGKRIKVNSIQAIAWGGLTKISAIEDFLKGLDVKVSRAKEKGRGVLKIEYNDQIIFLNELEVLIRTQIDELLTLPLNTFKSLFNSKKLPRPQGATRITNYTKETSEINIYHQTADELNQLWAVQWTGGNLDQVTELWNKVENTDLNHNIALNIVDYTISFSVAGERTIELKLGDYLLTKPKVGVLMAVNSDNFEKSFLIGE